jgi:hypothetical protein
LQPRSYPGRELTSGPFQPAPAEQLSEGIGRILLPLAGQKNERREHRLRFLEADVDLAANAPVPAEGGAAVALWRLVADEEAELEGLREAYVLKLRGRGESFG